MTNSREKELVEIQIEVRKILNTVSKDYIAFEIDYCNPERSPSYNRSKIIVGENYLFKIIAGETEIPFFSKLILGNGKPLLNTVLHEVGHHIVQKKLPLLSAFDDFARNLFYKIFTNKNKKISLSIAKKLYYFLPEEILADVVSLKLKRKLNKKGDNHE